MKNIEWIFLLYAVLVVTSMIGIAISISYANLMWIVLFTLSSGLFMGLGFRRKKKYQQAGKI